jgi:hypothetical protein
MSNFLTDQTFKMTLMNYTVGLYNDTKNKLAQFIAPTVQVPAMAGYFQRYDDREAFQVLPTDKAPGKSATLVGFNAKGAAYDCTPNALDTVIPSQLLEVTDAGAAMTHYQAIMNYLVSVANTNHEYQVFTKVAASIAADSSYGGSWSTASGSSATVNPFAQLETAIYDIAKNNGGVFPNKMIVGPNAWIYLKQAYATRGSFMVLPVNDASVKEYIAGLGAGNIQVKIGVMPYGSNMGQATRTMTGIVSTNDIYLFYSSETPFINDQSAFKTFQFGRGIDNLKTWVSLDQRDVFAGVDWNIDVQLANKYAIKRITVT